MQQPEVEALEIRLVLQAIHERYGYDLRDYAQPSIQRRMRSALLSSGCDNLGVLLHRLLTEPDLFARVLDELTVQVSEVFRDPAFYRAFREHVVPLLRTYPLIKIWHAGCAGGEEVHAMAILLTETGLYSRSQIYATDLSNSALERAKQGMYPERSLALFESNYRLSGGTGEFADYYTAGYGRIAFHQALRQNVVFFQHDLVSDHTLGEMQVVFCRNVMIYFGQELRRRVVEKFGSALCRGGFLCLGSSERLQSDSERGVFDRFVPDAAIYRFRGSS
ncbi:MAG TPA: protein-glutamate O-methyltransferase CheR [Polyangiaceae bacterium]